MMERLNVIDEKGNVLGEETRGRIHRKGLLHREIHVWLFNKKGEVLFQRRGPHQDTYPNLLDATIGGHVNIGEDYLFVAIRELKEEIGIKAGLNNLIFIGVFKSKSYDNVTTNTNNAIKKIYAYPFEGDIKNLKLEKEKVINLESWPITKLPNLKEKERKEFIQTLLSKEYLPLLRKIELIEFPKIEFPKLGEKK